METQTDNLGKVSVTVEKDFWSPNKSYDKLTIVLVEDKFATYISRKPVPTGMSLGNREFWIPFSSLKELIILDYSRISTKVDGLADVAYTGEYSDLKHTPDISNKTITLKRSDGSIIGEFTLNQASDKEIEINLPAAQIQADWKLADPTAVDFIKNKPNLKTVATTGSYHDLLDVPEIGQGKLIFTDGTNIRNNQFDANTTDNVTVALSKVAFTNEYKDLNGRHQLTINQNGASTVYDGTEDKAITISNQRVNNGELSIQKNGNEVAKFTADQANNTTVNLSKVAFTGDYSDLSGTPTVGNGTITIKCNNVLLDTFTTNLAEPKDINIIVPNAQGQPVVQVQSDWNESDPSDPAYINNKPTIGNGKVTVKLGSMELTFRVNDLGDTTITLQVANNGILTIRDNEQNNVHNFYADDAGNEVVILHKSAFSGNYDDLNNTPQGVLTLTRNGQPLATFSASDRSQQSVELGTPGDANTIESVSVNRIPVPIDPNKNVDLTIGDAVINIKLNGSLIQSFSLNQTGAPIDINLTDTVGDLNKIESISVNGNTQQIINKNVDLTIPPSGDINTIETISVNGLNQQIINKNVDLTITPGDTNKIESISINGIGLQTDPTKNVDIPLKTLTIKDSNGTILTTFNATQDAMVLLPASGAAPAGFTYEVYQNRSLVSNPQQTVIYLIGPTNSDYSQHDRFEQWIYTNGLGWAMIGTTELDLSNYYTRAQVDNLIGRGNLIFTIGNSGQSVTFNANDTQNQSITIGDGVLEIYQNNILKGTFSANSNNANAVRIDLDGSNGDPNIIEEVQVNGLALPINNKSVNVKVPEVYNTLLDLSYSRYSGLPYIISSTTIPRFTKSTLFIGLINADSSINPQGVESVNIRMPRGGNDFTMTPLYYQGSVITTSIFHNLTSYPYTSRKGLIFNYDIDTNTTNLIGVYNNNDSYSRTVIDAMFNNVHSFTYEFYGNLNNITNRNSDTLYIIGPSGSGADYYEEYVWYNNSFVKIGDITPNLSQYALISSLSQVAFTGDFTHLQNIPHDRLELMHVDPNNILPPVSLGTFDTNTNTQQTINIPIPGNGSLIILDELGSIREQFYADQRNDHYLQLADVAFTGNVSSLHGYVAPGQVNDGQLSINELDRSNNIVNTHLFTANQPTGSNVNVNLRSVAFTGDYNDLINTPPSGSTPLDGHLEINNVDNTNRTLQLYNFTADQLTGTVTQVNLRQVAFTADYNHLINRPNAVGVSPGNGLFVVTRTDNGGSTTNAANFTADEPTGNVVTLPLHEVAFTGNYSDLRGVPPAASAGNGLIDIISPQFYNHHQSFTVNLPGPSYIYLPRETYTPTKTIMGLLALNDIQLPPDAPLPLDLTTIILRTVNPHDLETIRGEHIFIGVDGTLLNSTNSIFYNGLVAEFRLTVSRRYSASGTPQNGYNLVHWSYTQNEGSGGGGNIDTISIDGQNIAADTDNNVNITRQLLLGCDIVLASQNTLNPGDITTQAPVLRPTILVVHNAKPHDYITINGLSMYINDNTPLSTQNSLFVDDEFDEFRITVYPDDPVTPHYYRIIHFSYYRNDRTLATLDGIFIEEGLTHELKFTRDLILGCNIIAGTASSSNIVTTNPVLRPSVIHINDVNPHNLLSINNIPMRINDSVVINFTNSPFRGIEVAEFRITVYPDNPISPNYYRIIHYSYSDNYRDTGTSDDDDDTTRGGLRRGTTTIPGSNNNSGVLRLLERTGNGSSFNRNVANSRVTALAGLLTSTFTVADGHTVRFTSGNLVYNARLAKWFLHTNLWDVLGDSQLSSPVYDLFNFGCNGVNYTLGASGLLLDNQKASVTNWSTSITDHILYNIRGHNTRDWGRAYDNDYFRNHNTTLRFYTPSSKEWHYLLFERAQEKRFALGKISVGRLEYRKIIIVIPDYTRPGSDPLTLHDINGGTFDSNVFTPSQAQSFTDAGYLILPQAGFRYGSDYQSDASVLNTFVEGVIYQSGDGMYPGGTNVGHVSALGFTSNGLSVYDNNVLATYGFPVRLIYGTAV